MIFPRFDDRLASTMSPYQDSERSVIVPTSHDVGLREPPDYEPDCAY